MTQQTAIVKYLIEARRPVAGYDLEKAELCGEWVGTRGGRSARGLVDSTTNEGEYKLDGYTYKISRTYHKEKDKKGRRKEYAYYEVVSGEKKIQKVEMVEK